jgi:hypothetical protein
VGKASGVLISGMHEEDQQVERKEERQDVTCKNCDRPGHSKPDCWSKDGGKEGQGPRQKKKGQKNEIVVVVTDDYKDELFAFTCMSDYVAVVDTLDVLKLRLETCLDSGASRHYCPDQTKFMNYKPTECKITMADGRTLMTTGVGDLHIDLPNRSDKTKTILKNAVHAPDMASTLISISRLNKAGFSVLFNKGMCTIKDTSARMIATISNSEGLYKIATTKQATEVQASNVVSGKMISKAHKKLGHILCGAIHAISKGFITLN